MDDIVLFGWNNEVLQQSIKLIKKNLEITELGNVKYLLGVNFEKVNNEIYLHQHTYINKLLVKFKDLPKSFVNLPFKVGFTLPPKVEEKEIVENEIMHKYPYRSLIGCLSFLANRSRPDISYAVNIMSQFCNGYTYQHWKIVVDILNYALNTKDYKMNLTDIKSRDLVSYSDANWGSRLSDRHSISGYIIYFCGIPITWKSSKQKCIALSSMESEFIALTQSVKELIWYSRIL